MRAMMVLTFASITALAGVQSYAAEKGPTLRDREQAACYNDAMKLCKQFVPDEAKITTCMMEHKAEITPTCLSFMNGEEK